MEGLQTPNDHHLAGVHPVQDRPECACGRQHSGQQHLFDPAPFDHDPPYAGAAIDFIHYTSCPALSVPPANCTCTDTAPLDTSALHDLLNERTYAPDDFVFGTSTHHDIKYPTHDPASAASAASDADDWHYGCTDDLYDD